jgi:hypothetical protein
MLRQTAIILIGFAMSPAALLSRISDSAARSGCIERGTDLH